MKIQFTLYVSKLQIIQRCRKITGTPIWIFDTGGQVWQQRELPLDGNPGWDTAISGASVYGNSVYTGIANGHLYAIDAKSGTEKWRYKTEGPVHSIPVVADGMVYGFNH